MTETREQWLEAAVDQLRPIFAEVKDVFLGEERDPDGRHDLPKVRVSVGWPSRGGTSNKGRVIGQCWKTTVAGDGVAQIFLSPILDGEGPVLETLVHELVHAWDDCQAGHKGRFARTARALGLEGKLTATHAGADLAQRFTGVVEAIGSYPHSPLNPFEMDKQRKKQSTRMLKLECPSCGYIVRTTQKWLDLGLPTCPCGQELEPA